jgi:hypothetical protein
MKKLMLWMIITKDGSTIKMTVAMIGGSYEES